MRALLDVTVLIALHDRNHIHHKRASEWFATHAKQGWASCPLTQNGCLRIMCQPAYPNPQPMAALLERISSPCNGPSSRRSGSYTTRKELLRA
ncbi:MAG: VapC toxin family domain ribonuclease [Ramlibacter sp.]|jgi:predicted nucleic acid-binding protein|nr:VapC toxin family domain ribonuclease [Ramlibacter sp.]